MLHALELASNIINGLLWFFLSYTLRLMRMIIIINDGFAKPTHPFRDISSTRYAGNHGYATPARFQNPADIVRIDTTHGGKGHRELRPDFADGFRSQETDRICFGLRGENGTYVHVVGAVFLGLQGF